MRSKGILSELGRNKSLYLMVLPGVVLIMLFSYFPMFGLLVAFKDFNFRDGILGSPWMDPIYGNFKYLFSSTSSALRATWNTLYLNTLFIIFGILFQVGIALIFNEVAGKYFKKITQSLMFLPYFISWIVVGVIAYNLFSIDTGVMNTTLSSLGLGSVDWFATPWVWPIILVLFYVWKSTGYGMVLYLASLTGIDPSYYEAAKIDGASKFQQIRYISLPFLMPTIITLTLLQVGRIMNADFGMFYAIVGENAAIYQTADVIDTFIFRSLRLNGDIGMASAAGFYQSVIAFIIIMLCNKLAKRINEDSSLF
ncbi:putative multiple-sugar transport system permease YteP [Paenibacillus plantiphilus]|uniref:Multiple-sugar transport system permease YteP n=1 Tax=Paenibacillus plantiphilus TaxID=2905650 RepID=A0ABM9CDA9_9BACL|nr:ABC transporter permease subunit [Paenibacillus plantiphilus]CAH1209595.1 putative multiple-sugar transport system permease YteP [Paenibacillus plantiphilus]